MNKNFFSFSLLLFLLIIPIVRSRSPYMCVTQGLFESVFSGANLTDELMAPDFKLPNGTSCCGEGGAGASYSCSDWAACTDDSLWDADKLDGQDGTYYLDDTTIGNCSVDMSCSPITYDSELAYIGNCSGANCDIGWGNLTSVPADIADGDDVGAGSENCSVDQSCSTIMYFTDYASIGYYTSTNFSTDYYGITSRYTSANHSGETHSYIGNCSGANCDIGWGNLTSVPAGFADGTDDVGSAADWSKIQNVTGAGLTNCPTGQIVAGRWQNGTFNCTTDQTAAGSGSMNCSVDNSCGLITYDSELAYVGNCSGANCDIGWGNLTSVPADIADGDDVGAGSENCSVDQSCSTIMYFTDYASIGYYTTTNHSAETHAYINNCSVDQSCANIIYTTDKLGNTTAEIRAQFGNSSNITYDSSTGTFYYNGTDKDTDTTIANCSVDQSCGTIMYFTDYASIGYYTTTNYSADRANSGFYTTTNHSAETHAYINNCSVDMSCSPITYDSELAYISNCSTEYSCTDVVYKGNTTWKIDNSTHSDTSSTGYDLSCTDCIGGTEIAELADADISNTLTCSDLQAGSEVVVDSEVDNDITIETNHNITITGSGATLHLDVYNSTHARIWMS